MSYKDRVRVVVGASISSLGVSIPLTAGFLGLWSGNIVLLAVILGLAIGAAWFFIGLINLNGLWDDDIRSSTNELGAGRVQ